MVEAVKNSTQAINSLTNSLPSCGQQSNPQMGGLFDYVPFEFNTQIDTGLDKLRETNERMLMYGPLLGGNDRLYDAHMRNMKQSGQAFETNSITVDDRQTILPLSERLNDYRIAGIRVHHDELVTSTLRGAMDAGKGVALYVTNCAEDGLNNPDLPEDAKYTFDNLKNPLKLVNDLMSVSLTAQEANKDVNLLADIALQEKCPELVACILKETSKGGLLRWGTDFGMAKKLLIDSKGKFDNDGDYHRFINSVDAASQRLFGESLDEHIAENYKPMFQQLAPIAGAGGGLMVGALKGLKSGVKRGGLIGAVIGAVAGGVAGAGFRSLHWFGENHEGETLLSSADNARQKDHQVNPSRYSPFEPGFGSLSSPVGLY